MWWERDGVKPFDCQCHKYLIKFPQFQDATFTTKLLCSWGAKEQRRPRGWPSTPTERNTRSLWSEQSRNRHCKCVLQAQGSNFGGHENKTSSVHAALLSCPAQAEEVARAGKPWDLGSRLFTAKNNWYLSTSDKLTSTHAHYFMPVPHIKQALLVSYITQAPLKLSILLTQPLTCWGHAIVLVHKLAFICLLKSINTCREILIFSSFLKKFSLFKLSLTVWYVLESLPCFFLVLDIRINLRNSIFTPFIFFNGLLHL